jgi:hypothetical protein
VERSEKPYDAGEERANSRFFGAYLYITMLAGLLLAAYYFISLVTVLINGNDAFWLTPSNTQGEARLKRAATRKINTALRNAQDLHDHSAEQSSPASTLSERGVSSSMTSSPLADQVTLKFVLNVQKMENVGGFKWTWGLLLSGDMFDTEGIWLPTRLIVFQGAQVLFMVMLALIFISITRYAAEQAEDAQASLPNDLPDWARQ